MTCITDLPSIFGSDVFNESTMRERLAPEVFDAIINPSDNDIFVNSDKWSHEEITALQVDCKNRLLQNAHDNGVLEKADKHGKEKVENLFKTFGFNVVNVMQQAN